MEIWSAPLLKLCFLGNSHMALKNTIYSFQNNSHRFCKIWKPFISDVENPPTHRMH